MCAPLRLFVPLAGGPVVYGLRVKHSEVLPAWLCVCEWVWKCTVHRCPHGARASKSVLQWCATRYSKQKLPLFANADS